MRARCPCKHAWIPADAQREGLLAARSQSGAEFPAGSAAARGPQPGSAEDGSEGASVRGGPAAAGGSLAVDGDSLAVEGGILRSSCDSAGTTLEATY